MLHSWTASIKVCMPAEPCPHMQSAVLYLHSMHQAVHPVLGLVHAPGQQLPLVEEHAGLPAVLTPVVDGHLAAR